MQTHSLQVTAQIGEAELCAKYCGQTGCLRILQEGNVVREWFPPNSWIAIASVAGARNWGTGPNADELRALLESESQTLQLRRE